MSEATHFIEQYRQKDKSLLISLHPKPINQLSHSLELTKSCNCITVAVFKIKPKPGILIAHHDNDLDTTIIEKA